MNGTWSTGSSARSRWLCPTELDRLRFLDMNERVRTARRVQGVSLGAASAFASGWYGWWLSGLVILALLILALLEVVYRHTSRPEVAGATSMGALALVLGTAVAGSGGAHSALLPFMAVPTVMLAARFRIAVVVAGVTASFAVTVAAIAVGLLLPRAPEVPDTVHVVVYLALLAALVSSSVTLLSAELTSRGDAVVDQLTGLFNRKALYGRLEEVEAQARLIGAPLSVVLLDLDHFKQVNDTYGHDRGDIVLRELAYRMRKTLRSFDLVYRLGGEEFLVLLPGHDELEAARVAQRVLADVAAQPLAGLQLTLSAGVAGGTGETLVVAELVKQADAALYAAKGAGRGCVHRADRLQQPLGA